MFKRARPFFIRVITPLHAGSGQDLGIVDLPIQRERHTSFPKIEASGLKGSIREVFEEYLIKKESIKDDKVIIKFDLDISLKERLENDELFEVLKQEWKVVHIKNEKNNKIEREIHYTKFNETIFLLFGPEDTDNAFAGALGFTDARILLFPVKSVKGVFAWITCNKIIERFLEDMELANEKFDNFDIPKVDDGMCMVTENSKVIINNETIILEEYAFNVLDNKIDSKFINEFFKYLNIDKDRIIILSDNDFTDFVNLSTEVITRTKIDNLTGTVDKSIGGLWTEEYLPSETIMYSLVLANSIFKKNEEKGIFNKNDIPDEKQILDFWVKSIPDVIQIGGNATIGKGIVEIIKVEEE